MNAAGRAPLAAGFLHEDVWLTLLRREDPNTYGSRLARGDGGVDTYAVVDPASGEMSVYQAKLCRVIDAAKRAEILDGFEKALSHTFKCIRWTLLVPIVLSTDESSWLYGSMKDAAIAATNDAAIKGKIAACAVRHLDESALLDRLEQNPDVAQLKLPSSRLALAALLADERHQRADLERDVVARLRHVYEALVRARVIEVRTTEVAARVLNQGWSDMLGAVRLAARPGNMSLLEGAARDLADFAERRLDMAMRVEGMLPGGSEAVMGIFLGARMLAQSAVLAQLNQVADAVAIQEAQDLVAEASAFLQRLAELLRMLTLR
ncbi:MAG: hypothetical protein ACRENE_10070 [Polyangiaceae bacterium]